MATDARNRLIDLLEQAEGQVNNGVPSLEMQADFLIANGVHLLDMAVISPKNQPLMTHFANMPLYEVFDLVTAKLKGNLQEVKHGKWKYIHSNNHLIYCECSICGKKLFDHARYIGADFCHGCGAKMDGVKNGN